MAFNTLSLFPGIPYSKASIYLEKQKGLHFGIIPVGYSQNHAKNSRKESYLALCPNNANAQEDVHVRIVPKEVNYQLLQKWISDCRKLHKACTPIESSHLLWRLVDCQEGTLIPAPSGCSYLALSYVWAKNGSKEDQVRKPEQAAVLLGNLTKAIRDAIEVTRRLGERYLWVDKFCIDQENLDKNKDQILDMGLIYECAEVTIFAVYGQDGNFGLPGVNGTPRRVQASALIKGMQFASTLGHSFSIVRNSKWSTRSWTHQEAILSHWRLFSRKSKRTSCAMVGNAGNLFMYRSINFRNGEEIASLVLRGRFNYLVLGNVIDFLISGDTLGNILAAA